MSNIKKKTKGPWPNRSNRGTHEASRAGKDLEKPLEGAQSKRWLALACFSLFWP